MEDLNLVEEFYILLGFFCVCFLEVIKLKEGFTMTFKSGCFFVFLKKKLFFFFRVFAIDLIFRKAFTVRLFFFLAVCVFSQRFGLISMPFFDF